MKNQAMRPKAVKARAATLTIRVAIRAASSSDGSSSGLVLHAFDFPRIR
jgi:hypothetical protein